MLGELEVLEIKMLFKQGKSLKHISKVTGCSINTVRRYARDDKQSGYSRRESKNGKLDLYKDYLKMRVDSAYPNWIPATVLFNEIRSQGYLGKISLLRSYLKTLKPQVKERPNIRFETKPGEQMQVDFATFKQDKLKFYAFVAVLGYSRMIYVEFVNNQNEDTVIKCHENAFHYFSGVPLYGLYDNMKTIIIKRNAYGPGKHKLNANFYDFAKHYGFVPLVCKPYNPQTKGKVERAISYLRNSFYYPFIAGKKHVGLDELNIAVIDWLNNIANKRIHSTTKEVPIKRWAIEKQHLLNVPQNYTTNYGLAKNLTIAKQNKHIMHENEQSLQHELSIYDELLPLGAQ